MPEALESLNDLMKTEKQHVRDGPINPVPPDMNTSFLSTMLRSLAHNIRCLVNILNMNLELKYLSIGSNIDHRAILLETSQVAIKPLMTTLCV